jgi:hypothetical protein
MEKQLKENLDKEVNERNMWKKITRTAYKTPFFNVVSPCRRNMLIC